MLFRSRSTKHLVSLPGWPAQRGFELHRPQELANDATTPLVIVLHGFTHDSRTMRGLTSPTGESAHPDSLDSLAERQGFLVAYPNGTSLGLLPGRCWNGGGGVNGYAAVAKKAVDKKVDDVGYLEDLIDHIATFEPIDPKRVFLAGISNGAALAHRFAVERPDRVAAIAAVAGCNQHSAAQLLSPPRAVPILHIHGTSDPIWPYQGTHLPGLGRMESVEESVNRWAEANQAHLSELNPGPPWAEDGMSLERRLFRGKDERSEVRLLTFIGAGHAWPGGRQYLPEKLIGKVPKSFSANREIWDFFQSVAGRTTGSKKKIAKDPR